MLHCPKCHSSDLTFRKKKNVYICDNCDHEFHTKQSFTAKRIFISYGHDEHAALAEKLKNDLEKRGQLVWFDRNRIPLGPDWELSIEQGLAWLRENRENSLFIIIMTPHSVRRPDAYCLNEIAYAVSKKFDILPIMLVYCEPPLSILRYQYLDMQDCLPIDIHATRYEKHFERLCQAIEQNHRDFEGNQAYFMKYLDPFSLSFNAQVLSKLPNFVGRGWVIEAIDRWLSDPEGSKVFWISGKAGIGKSSLSVWLVENRPEIAAFHMCEYRNNNKSDPKICLLFLVYQLTQELPDYQEKLLQRDISKDVLESDASTLFDSLVVEPLSMIKAPEHNFVILIDALDEASQGRVNDLAEFIANDFKKTPSWLRLIVTSRPETNIQTYFQSIDPFDLDKAKDQNENDIKTYLQTALKPFYPDQPISSGVLQTIVEKSEMVFTYVQQIIQELHAGRLSLDRLDEFPRGLGEYFFTWFKRQFPEADKRKHDSQGTVEIYKKQCLPLLELLAVAQEPLALNTIKSILNWGDYGDDIINFFGSLLIKDETVHPFHSSLMDWLEDSQRSYPYTIRAIAGHRRMMEYGWGVYEDNVQTLPVYFLRRLPLHLMALEEWDRIRQFLCEPHILSHWSRDKQQYELLALWRQIGEALDMVALYMEATVHLGASDFSPRRKQQILRSIASFLALNGHYSSAETLLRQALAILMELEEASLIDVTECKEDLARVYTHQYKQAPALRLFKEVEKAYESELGLDHSDMADLFTHMSDLYYQQCRFTEAAHYCRQALNIHKKHFHFNHSLLADSQHALANINRSQGCGEEAESLYLRCLNIHHENLGDDHIKVADVLHDLAILYFQQNNITQAEYHFKRAFEIRNRFLGASHPQIADTLSALADVMVSKGDLTGAERYYQDALQMLETSFGKESVKRADVMERFAELYIRQDRFEPAMRLLDETLSIRNKYLGPIQFDTMRARRKRTQLQLRYEGLDKRSAFANRNEFLDIESRLAETYGQAIYDAFVEKKSPEPGDLLPPQTAVQLQNDLALLRDVIEIRLYADVLSYTMVQYRICELSGDWGDVGKDRADFNLMQVLLSLPPDEEIQFHHYSLYAEAREELMGTLHLDRLNKESIDALKKKMEWFELKILNKKFNLKSKEINRILAWLKSNHRLTNSSECLLWGRADCFGMQNNTISIYHHEEMRSPLLANYCVSFSKDTEIILREEGINYVMYIKWASVFNGSAFAPTAKEQISDRLKQCALEACRIGTRRDFELQKDFFISAMMENIFYYELTDKSLNEVVGSISVGMQSGLRNFHNKNFLAHVNCLTCEWHPLVDGKVSPIGNILDTAIEKSDYNRALQLLYIYLSDGWFLDTDISFMYPYTHILYLLILPYLKEPLYVDFEMMQKDLPTLFDFMISEYKRMLEHLHNFLLKRSYIDEGKECHFENIKDKILCFQTLYETLGTHFDTEWVKSINFWRNFFSRVLREDPLFHQALTIQIQEYQMDFYAKLLSRFHGQKQYDPSPAGVENYIIEQMTDRGYSIRDKQMIYLPLSELGLD